MSDVFIVVKAQTFAPDRSLPSHYNNLSHMFKNFPWISAMNQEKDLAGG